MSNERANMAKPIPIARNACYAFRLKRRFRQESLSAEGIANQHVNNAVMSDVNEEQTLDRKEKRQQY